MPLKTKRSKSSGVSPGLTRFRLERSRATLLPLRLVKKSAAENAKRYALFSGNHLTICHPAKYAYAARLSFTYRARFTINIL
jgi:hypothetical protein